MMSNLSLSLTPVLIASLVSLIPSLVWSQTEEMPQLQFICQSEQTPPMTVIQMDGQTEVIATWYSAQKLQQRYERQQPSLFASELIRSARLGFQGWDVCLVSEEGQRCTEESSEVLFSVSGNYRCILEN